MPRRNSGPRSFLKPESTIRPALAARHKIVHNPEDQEDVLTGFFLDLRHVLATACNGGADIGTESRRTDRPLYTIYEDADKTAITVLERRLSHDFAQRHRIHWTKKDVGRITGEIQDSVIRLELAGRPIKVEFDSVVRVGDADEKRARKLALIPNQASNEAEFFCQEHEIAVNGIGGSLKRFRYPYGPYIPHFTVCRLFRELPNNKVNSVIENIRDHLLPLNVEVQPLEIYSQQDHTPSELWRNVGQKSSPNADFVEGPNY